MNSHLPRRLLLVLWFVVVCAPATPAARADALASIVQFQTPAQWVEIEGRGYGHAVGLCQWGARGRALAGQRAEEIVRAYYQGTSVERLVAADSPVRVLVEPGHPPAIERPARVVGRGGAWRVVGLPRLFSGGSALEVLSVDRVAGQPLLLLRYRVVDGAGAQVQEAATADTLKLEPVEPSTRFEVQHKRAAAVPGRDEQTYNTYRGEIALVAREGDGEVAVLTINHVRLDDYLRGVVPAEMPATWPLEALKAQTLAARTYSVHRIRAGRPLYDLDDTQQSQVYLGVHAERPRVSALVDETSGQVITYRGSPIEAYYSSTCAGASESNENVWLGPPIPYLRGVPDISAAGQPFDVESPRFRWSSGPLTVAELEAVFNQDPDTAIGRLVGLDLSIKAPSGRVVQIRVVGSTTMRTVRASSFRSLFTRYAPDGVQPLLSTWFEVRVVPPPPAGSRSPGLGGAAAPAFAPRTAPPSVTAPAPPPLQLEKTAPVAPLPPAPDTAFFPQTGHNASSTFLRHFADRGALQLYGLPRTEPLDEDGRLVQYFQRARLELHPEHAGTPYDVQLTLLGDLLTTSRRPFPKVPPFEPTAEHWHFPETGHGLHYAFLAFFERNGGVDTFGYPISEELYGENGWPHAVQYFQRARFEYHPELPESYRVSLGLLGDEYLVKKGWLR